MSVIRWTREDRRVLLPILILAPYPITDLSGVGATALVDTGSTVSGVAKRVAERLQLAKLGKRPLTSAQGQGQVERYAFRVGLSTGESPAFPFVFDEIIGIELTNTFDFDALIGMDVLKQCDFTMSRDRSCSLVFG